MAESNQRPVSGIERGRAEGLVGSSRCWWSPLFILVAGICAWLWPFGVGGSMPVGGDVTNFTIGLMAELSRALKSVRIPIWNANWGYGFDGLAESQMGVFYPPHILFYGFLPTEVAYTASLVFHSLLGAFGAVWLARRFDVSRWGSVLAGMVWSCSGFYVIHFPHQWGYTTGSWMPWAWGLAWSLAQGKGGRRTGLLLSGVLAFQILPGHFQLAFETQVTVLLIVILRRAKSILPALLALVGAMVLASMQVTSTWRLADAAKGSRDWEYLSGFAATPLHLISYVAPGLFHRSPLWRVLAWDPFHTAPEEHLAYIGIAPLFLVFFAFCKGVGRDHRTLVLSILAVVTLILGLGPYGPGFGWLSKLPGFSFFRAPARWGLATDLALAVLTGCGFDELTQSKKLWRWVVPFAVGAVVWTAGVVGLIELAFRSSDRPGTKQASQLLTWAFAKLPWPEDPPLTQVMERARKPQNDLRISTGLAREGWGNAPRQGIRLDRVRHRILREELAHGVFALIALLPIIPLIRKPKILSIYIFMLSFLDLWILGREKGGGAEAFPIARLAKQSRVLWRLAREPKGTRVVASLGNLPIVAGVAPLKAYRTIDLPVMPGITSRAYAPIPLSEVDSVARAMRVAGASVRIFDPFEVQLMQRLRRAKTGRIPDFEIINDEALATWLYGSEWIKAQGAWAKRFGLWKPGNSSTIAWLIKGSAPAAKAENSHAMDDHAYNSLIDSLTRARPLVVESARPELMRIRAEANHEPARVLICQLNDPGWSATWHTDHSSIPATIHEAWVGWQRIDLLGPGDWTLELTFHEPLLRIFGPVSLVAWIVWLTLLIRSAKPSTTQPATAP